MNEKMNYTEIFQMLASIVKEIAKAEVDNAKYDRTFKAVVSKKISNVKYEIEYHNQTYTATSSKEHKVDEIVRVCAPQDDWNELFIL